MSAISVKNHGRYELVLIIFKVNVDCMIYFCAHFVFCWWKSSSKKEKSENYISHHPLCKKRNTQIFNNYKHKCAFELYFIVLLKRNLNWSGQISDIIIHNLRQIVSITWVFFYCLSFIQSRLILHFHERLTQLSSLMFLSTNIILISISLFDFCQ